MSEEEIIKMLKEYSATNPFKKNIFYVSNLHEAIQGLLDLYTKEKEKNKELLEGLKYRVNYCKLLEKELYSNEINYNMELTKIEQKYLQELLEERN